MAAAPHRHSRVDNADYLLNAWAVSWVAHQIAADPLHLFDANTFWPGRRALGYSEAMLVQGVMAAPVRWLGGSPILAFNVAMLLGFVLTAFAFGLLVHRWTGSLAAALVAASAAAFNAHIISRSAHLQAMHLEFVALALWAMDRMFTSGRWRHAAMLGVSVALQGLTSIYLLMFTAWAMIFAGLARFVSADAARRGRAIRLAAGAAATALILLAPYLAAYYGVHADQGFSRSPEETGALAGSYADYLSTVSHLHYWWSAPFFERSRSTNFPGVTVLLLSIVALCARETRRDARVRMCAAVAAGCALVSFVPHLPGYAVVHRLVPMFWAVRVQAHLGQFVLLALAVLAGFGTAWLARSRPWRPLTWATVASALVLAINAEVFRAPIGYRNFDGIPAIYDVLRSEPRAVIVELPLHESRGIFRNAWYQLHSTRHWHPIANGYSGFIPRHYGRLLADVRTFPDEAALQALHRRGFTHVIVHRRAFVEHFGEAAFDAIGAVTTIRQVARDGDITIYRLH